MRRIRVSMLFENGPGFTITRFRCFCSLFPAFPACSSRKSKFPGFLMRVQRSELSHPTPYSVLTASRAGCLKVAGLFGVLLKPVSC